MILAILLAASGAGVDRMQAETVRLKPVADTSLLEKVAHNNLGQSWLAAGVLSNRQRSRALLRFDLSVLPPNVQIDSATLALHVSREPGLPQSAAFRLHRVLVPWGEGDKGRQGIDIGAAATTGEANWLAAIAPDVLWASPGGSAGTDFQTTPSAEISAIDGTTMAFPSSPSLVADLEAWLVAPTNNYGWLLTTPDGAPAGSARRFGSRETAGAEPELTIEYHAPAATVRIGSIQRVGDEVRINFDALAGKLYRVDFVPEVGSTNWTLLTFEASKFFPTNFAVADPIGPDPRRFYRLVEVGDID